MMYLDSCPPCFIYSAFYISKETRKRMNLPVARIVYLCVLFLQGVHSHGRNIYFWHAHKNAGAHYSTEVPEAIANNM